MAPRSGDEQAPGAVEAAAARAASQPGNGPAVEPDGRPPGRRQSSKRPLGGARPPSGVTIAAMALDGPPRHRPAHRRDWPAAAGAGDHAVPLDGRDQPARASAGQDQHRRRGPALLHRVRRDAGRRVPPSTTASCRLAADSPRTRRAPPIRRAGRRSPSRCWSSAATAATASPCASSTPPAGPGRPCHGRRGSTRGRAARRRAARTHRCRAGCSGRCSTRCRRWSCGAAARTTSGLSSSSICRASSTTCCRRCSPGASKAACR